MVKLIWNFLKVFTIYFIIYKRRGNWKSGANNKGRGGWKSSACRGRKNGTVVENVKPVIKTEEVVEKMIQLLLQAGYVLKWTTGKEWICL